MQRDDEWSQLRLVFVSVGHDLTAVRRRILEEQLARRGASILSPPVEKLRRQRLPRRPVTGAFKEKGLVASVKDASWFRRGTHVIFSAKYPPSLAAVAKNLVTTEEDVIGWLAAAEQRLATEGEGCPEAVSIEWLTTCLRVGRVVDSTAYRVERSLVSGQSDSIRSANGREKVPRRTGDEPFSGEEVIEVENVPCERSDGRVQSTPGDSADDGKRVGLASGYGEDEKKEPSEGETAALQTPLAETPPRDSDNSSEGRVEDDGGDAKPGASRLLGGKELTANQKRLIARKHRFACQTPPRSAAAETALPVPPPNSTLTQELFESALLPSTTEVGETCHSLRAGKRQTCLSALPSPSGGNVNLNGELCAMLKRLEGAYKTQKDEMWRQRNYRIAGQLIANLKFRICRVEDLDRPEVKLGEKTKNKIREYIRTGAISRLSHLENDEHLKAISPLTKIWGVAGATAEKLNSLGFKTIEDLRRNPEVLNTNQKIGLEFYEEINSRMPRGEVEEITAVVKAVVEKLYPAKLELITCGSYRRGSPDSGDVDILMARYDEALPTSELQRIVQRLRSNKFLTHDLTDPFSTHSKTHHSQSYMGLCLLPRPGALHRRIDIKIYPRSEYGFALMYFTGNDHFNRSMRLFARKLGYSLSDHDLTPVVRVRGQEKMQAGVPLTCRTERDVFEVLGLDYREPTEREIDAQWMADTSHERAKRVVDGEVDIPLMRRAGREDCNSLKAVMEEEVDGEEGEDVTRTLTPKRRRVAPCGESDKEDILLMMDD